MRIKRGFTLIELLVVIAIIGILSGVLISLLKPSFFFGQARDARRRAVLSDVGAAAEAYNAEFGHYLAGPAPLGEYLKNGLPVGEPDPVVNKYVYIYGWARFCAYTVCDSCDSGYLKYDYREGKVIETSDLSCP